VGALSGRALLTGLSIVALAMPALGVAQQASQSAGRLSYLEGSVSVLPPGGQDWSHAFLNRPVSAGDQLWSDSGSRAEVDLGGVTVRVAGNSEISMLDLSESGLQLGVGVGTVEIALHYADSTRAFEIDSPEVAMVLQRDGDYRVNVDLDGTTTVLVRSGAVHLTNRSGEGISLRDGQGVVFAADDTLDVADAHAADGFDRWCAQRDTQWRQTQQSATANVPDNVNDVPGADQLADAGEWSNQPDYGAVWFPSAMPAGWAPFQSGRWAWVPPWGWTWIDRAPWGFAPFHYGHWATINGRWGWIPPAPRGQRSFSPALVAVPASVIAAPATLAPASHGTLPPRSVMHRPVVTTHVSVSLAAAAVPHVVVSAPAARPVNQYAPIPALMGPTIYARDVRAVEHAADTNSPQARAGAVRAPLVAAPAASLTTARPEGGSNRPTALTRRPPVSKAAPLPTSAPPPPPARTVHPNPTSRPAVRATN
jgi:hypothetical protein